MRAQKSAKNIIVALISNALNIVLGVVVQSIFLKTLGEEYLGLNTVLTSILSMLSIAELGLGSAIIYNMYKPIANKDKEKIKSLMKFYKKCYSIIIIVMLAIGLIVSIFLKQIVGETQTIQNLYLLYFLFLTDVIFSYTIAYKRSIIYANQEEYLTNIVHLIYSKNISVLLDEKKQIINMTDEKFNAKFLSDISFSKNDYTLNTLLTLLPKKIYIHLIDDYIDEFINTLKLIFEKRISYCHDCDICNIYKIPKTSLALKKE